MLERLVARRWPVSGVETPWDFPHAFRAAWMARDGTAIGALFAPDADFVNVVGIWWEDRQAIAGSHAYALGSFFADTHLAVGRVKVRLMGDVAIVHARMRLSGQRAPEGGAASDRTTILTFVLRRGDAGWLAIAAQNTDVVPGSETLVGDGEGLVARDYRPGPPG